MGNKTSSFSATSDSLIAQQQIKLLKDLKERVILLLGPGEVGRSTLFKQARNAERKYSTEDLTVYSSIVNFNLVQTLLRFAQTKMECQSPINQQILKSIDLDDDFANWMHNQQKIFAFLDKVVPLIDDLTFKQFWDKRHEYQVTDGMDHLLHQLKHDKERLLSPDYIPTWQEVVNTYVKTTGFLQWDFNHQGQQITIEDAGGQRTERVKWQYVMESSTEIVYMVALNDYYKKCYEDNSTNRMLESLTLFESLCNNTHIQNCYRVYLIFNKVDQFKEKLTKFPISDFFPEFKGRSRHPTDVLEFIVNSYKKKAAKLINPSKLSIHFITAVDVKSGPWFLELLKHGTAPDPVELPIIEPDLSLLNSLHAKHYTDVLLITGTSPSH